jgi:hypothetical protein
MAMASPKQIEANRRNAKKSTGPRTSAGKAKVALNAIKHGLLAKQVVLPNEDEEEFAEFTVRLAHELQPVGELEDLLVGMIAACAWRLRRLQRVEKGLFIEYVHEEAQVGAGQQDQKPSRGRQPAAITIHVLEHEEFEEFVAATRRDIEQLEKQLREAEERAESAERLVEQADAIRAAGDAPMGRAFRADAQNTDAFSRLSRYETHIQRSMFKALDELRRLQQARRQTMPDAPASLELEERNEA